MGVSLYDCYLKILSLHSSRPRESQKGMFRTDHYFLCCVLMVWIGASFCIRYRRYLALWPVDLIVIIARNAVSAGLHHSPFIFLQFLNLAREVRLSLCISAADVFIVV